MRRLLTAGFFRRIMLPAMLAILLFIVSVFAFIIPAFESNAMRQKRAMLHELTNTTWSILQKYHNDQLDGLLSAEDAQQRAISEIEVLRYGPDKKDYFWITDMAPVMIMHPYVHELTGKSLQDYADPDGKKIFIEAVEIARSSGEGFINYQWQFKDDSTHIVPKLSFVKKFEPWNWIIGTGIYLHDVQMETSALARKLIYILLVITFIISLIIAFIAFQSLKIEGRRQAVEAQLLESKEKYKSLIESSTEGIILLLNNRISYSNSFIRQWLRYSGEELSELETGTIFPSGDVPDFSSIRDETRVETLLKRKDGTTTEAVLTILPVRFADKEGLLLTFRDASEHRSVKTKMLDLNLLLEKISAHSGIGLFRFSLTGKGRLTEFNLNLMKMLGYRNDSEFRNIPLAQILADRSDLRRLLTELKENLSVTERKICLKQKNGSIIETRMTLLISGQSGDTLFCDGFVEKADISLAPEEDSLELQELLSIIQNSDMPVKSLAGPVISCPGEATISHAIEIMQSNHSTFVLLMLNQKPVGMLTHADLVTRFLSQGASANSPASGFMTAPLIFTDETANLAEAMAIMDENKLAHLVIRNHSGDVTGVFEKNKVAGFFINPADILERAIDRSIGSAGLFRLRNQIPAIIRPMLALPGSMHTVSRMMALINDAITTKIIRQAIGELGEPPVPFVFFTTGSEGREEPVLNSDQDNAIVYADTPGVDAETTREYFLSLAGKICSRLDESGLPVCKGGYMASNPDWCRPLSAWKGYFDDWIVNSDPANILNISAFFDLRPLYGDKKLFIQLEEHIFSALDGRSAFFFMLAKSIIAFRPPLGVFGNILTETSGKNSEAIDIKNCMSPVVMFARIYALYHNVRAKGTVDRINAIKALKVLSPATCDEITFHFNFLMHQRLKHQLNQWSADIPPDNLAEPKKMTEMEQMILKKVLSQIGSYQDNLSVSFMGGQKGL